MALSKDILGQALYDATTGFNDTDIDPADMEAQRLALWKVVADTVINHFKTLGVVSVAVVTTGTATNHTGTGTGTIG